MRDSQLSQQASTSPEDETRQNGQLPEADSVPLEDANIPRSPVMTDSGLPRLQRPHKRRKLLLLIGVTLITLDLCVLPIVYFYALRFGTNLNLQDIFAVITGVYGLLSFTHYFFRSLKLFLKKKAVNFAPVGWTRWGMLEFLNVNIAIVITLVEIELVAGTAPNNPIVRLCAMPSPTICFYMGFLFLFSSTMASLRVRLPFNMSSTPKGTPWRPALLGFIEDFGAIEMRGEKGFRAQLMRRYDESFMFRRMIMVISWCWGVGLLVVAIVATVLIMVLPENIGFGVGWGLPYACSAVMAVFTIIFAKKSLRREREAWATPKQVGAPSVV